MMVDLKADPWTCCSNTDSEEHRDHVAALKEDTSTVAFVDAEDFACKGNAASIDVESALPAVATVLVVA